MRLDDITVGTVAIGGLRVRRLGLPGRRGTGTAPRRESPQTRHSQTGTKAGFKPGKIEPGKTSLPPLGHPDHIKEECDKSLRGTPAAVAAGEIADERGITSQQVALARALTHSPAMLPIPGTSKLPHLEENIDAAFVELSTDETARLESAAAPG